VWSSNNANAVSVNGSGLATAVGNGTATITATTGGVQGSITLMVSQTVAAIAVTPEGPLGFSLLGATGSLAAVVQDSGGSAIPGVNLAWASDNEAAATVSIDGSVTAVANGVANITASALGVTSNAVEITVDATLRLNTTD